MKKKRIEFKEIVVKPNDTIYLHVDMKAETAEAFTISDNKTKEMSKVKSVNN